MYKPKYKRDGSLIHSDECMMMFGKKDPECPRCQQLLKGLIEKRRKEKNKNKKIRTTYGYL